MRVRLNQFASIYQRGNQSCYIQTPEKAYSLKDIFCIKIIQKLLRRRVECSDASIVVSREANATFRFLLEEGVFVVDGKNNNLKECLYLFSFFKNPNIFLHKPSLDEELEIIKKAHPARIDTAPANRPPDMRYSCRAFLSKKVSRKILNDIATDSYGMKWQQKKFPYISHTPIASAGALNQLYIHILEKESDTFLHFKFDYVKNILEKKSKKVSLSDFKNCLLSDLSIGCRDAPYYVVIIGDISLPCKKYGYRGLMYLISEAGALAHQLTEVLRRSNLQSVQLGGYYDDPLVKLLGNSCGTAPLSVIAFGYGKE